MDPKTSIIYENGPPSDCALTNEIQVSTSNGTAYTYFGKTGEIKVFAGTIYLSQFNAHTFSGNDIFWIYGGNAGPVRMYGLDEMRGQTPPNDCLFVVDKKWEERCKAYALSIVKRRPLKRSRYLLDTLSRYTPFGFCLVLVRKHCVYGYIRMLHSCDNAVTWIYFVPVGNTWPVLVKPVYQAAKADPKSLDEIISSRENTGVEKSASGEFCIKKYSKIWHVAHNTMALYDCQYAVVVLFNPKTMETLSINIDRNRLAYHRCFRQLQDYFTELAGDESSWFWWWWW